jgi:hypothetical protein
VFVGVCNSFYYFIHRLKRRKRRKGQSKMIAIVNENDINVAEWEMSMPPRVGETISVEIAEKSTGPNVVYTETVYTVVDVVYGMRWYKGRGYKNVSTMIIVEKKNQTKENS